MPPATLTPTNFRADEAFARQLDAEDPLRAFRDRFHIPVGKDGRPVVYLCGNSLGLMPKSAKDFVAKELQSWQEHAVDAHFAQGADWYNYHERFRDGVGRLVGAGPHEVVVMNSLTVNLHLMMVSFYRPTRLRYKILIDDPVFPSDLYAIKSQIFAHRFKPDDALVVVRPQEGEHTLHPGDITSILEDHGDQIALVLLAGVNYFTGQVLDMQRIAATAQREGCTIGYDLGHAVGNVPLAVHDWGVDFAVWCSYKYLNAGPGAIAGAFVHERHAKNPRLNRLAGWWGNDPKTRFRMQLEPDFHPVESADGWQVSNPPIFSAAPLRASLEIFDEATMPKLREKSEKLTGYLAYLLDHIPNQRFEIITPREPQSRGSQLSILVHDRPKELFAQLEAADMKCDFREPNIIRAAPVPLYNTFHEVWRFAQALSRQ